MSQITFIRRKDVLRRSGLRKTLMYERIQSGLFPKPIAISERGRAWREDVIDGYNKLIASGATDKDISDFCASAELPKTTLSPKRIKALA